MSGPHMNKGQRKSWHERITIGSGGGIQIDGRTMACPYCARTISVNHVRFIRRPQPRPPSPWHELAGFPPGEFSTQALDH